MDHSRPSLRHGRIRIAVIGLMLLVPAGIATARQLSPPSSSPATGHAQVVTQGIAVLSNEPMIWRVVERTAQPRWEAKAGSRVLGFILASDEPVLLSNINEAGVTKDVARLGVGEAFLVEAGTKQIRASMSDQPVPYLSLELVPAADANKIGNGTVLYQSDPFSAPDGERDVDLVRNVLEHNETATLPDTGQPVYILATDGAIDIEPAHGNRTTLETGQSGIFTGELTIKAVTPAASSSNQAGAVRLSVGMLQASDGGAGYVVAVIGDEIPPVQTPTPSPTITPTPSDTPVATDTQEPTDEPTIAQPTEEPTETPTEEPTATSTPNLDFDGDGLLDVDEREYGADPKNPDTDGDGLSDGDEVYTYHTNPAGTDSDGDGLTDGDEVNNYGTDPANADTDGDGLPDGREIESNHDPLDPADPPRLR